MPPSRMTPRSFAESFVSSRSQFQSPVPGAGPPLRPPPSYRSSEYNSRLSLASRSPSPSRHPTVRSVSVASFLTDGTVEIEGFGFDNASDAGDNESNYDSRSLYEGSIYDGEEGSGDISWRAERILANAKKKLDLCGANLSRARSSLVLSPTITPGAARARRVQTVSPPQLPERYRFDRGINGGNGNRFRASSESAVHPVGGHGGTFSPEALDTIQDDEEDEAPTMARSQSELGSSKSTQKKRFLRDQMKELHERIASLQQLTDSLQRPRSTHPRSTHSLRSNGSESKDDEWRHARAYSESTSRSSTPKPSRTQSRAESQFSERHEDRTDAFSYDSYLIGNTIFPSPHLPYHAPMRIDSLSKQQSLDALDEDENRRAHYRESFTSDSSANTILVPPTAPALHRKESLASISSYATAAEETPIASPTPYEADTRDDGYHSAPHTPHLPHKPRPMPQQPPSPPRPVMSESLNGASWYRESTDTITETALRKHTSIIARAVAVAQRDSQTMLVGGRKGEEEGIELEVRMDKEDRRLVQDMIESLGRMCCALDREEEERGRSVLRGRLMAALAALEGEEEGGVF